MKALEFIHGIQSGLLMRPPGGGIVRRWETFAETLGAIWLKRRVLWEGGERVDSESFPPGDARVRPGSAPPPSFLPLLQTRQRHPRPSCPRGDKELAGRAGGSGIRAPLSHRCNPANQPFAFPFHSSWGFLLGPQTLNFCAGRSCACAARA